MTAMILAGLFMLSPGQARAQGPNTDTVIVLPFENTSNSPEFNWLGESFADSLADLFNLPGLRVVSSYERELAYQRVRLPMTTLPSRATAIKLAREAKATMVVLGTYSVTPAQGDAPASIQGTARVIKVNEGRMMGEIMPDGRWATPVFDFGGALTTLQSMQGSLAYYICYQRDKALSLSRNTFIQRATKIPPLAFEAYIKGAQTKTNDPKRAIYLKNALKLYADANAGAVYPEAAFLLGHYFLEQQDWANAAEYLSRLRKKDPHYAEAAFYAGLAYWRLNDFSHALDALVSLATDTQLTAIYNNVGAISIQAAREEKNPAERARLLSQAISFLARAAESAPDDANVRFNYGYALFLTDRFAEAADQLRTVIAAKPRDGEAYFLFAKSLERAGRATDAATADDQARRYLQVYARWQTEWQKSQTAANVMPLLQLNFNRSNYFASIKGRADENADMSSDSGTQELLASARDLYGAGRDEEALVVLRRVLTVEPMSAEAYLLIGRINQRRGDLDASISALKTAIFWDAKLIDAHILLGRIFIERGDRAQATAYANSAIKIDPNNPDAIALQRQVQTGGK